LPRFFIERLTKPGDIVYDPFMGRGTTLLEAALLGRVPQGCDINPLSLQLCRPRLRPPAWGQVAKRLGEIDFADPADLPEDLLVFYHPDTLVQLSSLKHYLMRRKESGDWDAVDDWIGMVALNRLTGHSPGFFSIYTLPPNQAVSVKSQRRINERRAQKPSFRDVPAIILKKTKSLQRHCLPAEKKSLERMAERSVFVIGSAASTPALASDSVDLVVTSPPFLDVVDYATDNWLRCWFIGVSAKALGLTVPKKLKDWGEAMTGVFRELHRVMKPGSWVAFEVGEVRKGRVRLEEMVVPCGLAAGLKAELLLINDQKFTKTANCWGVSNNTKGTNSNRIVLFRKEA